jgi:hypothetical protein
MKTVIKILFLALAVYLSYSLVAHGQTVNPGTVNDMNIAARDSKKVDKPEEKKLDFQEYDNPEMDEEDSFSYDQDFLTRKLFQKKLAPLTPKERVVWSFRMADTNIFL